MRVALIAPLVAPLREPHEGGAQVVVADLAKALAARGHDVQLYACVGSVVDGVPVVTLGIEHTSTVAVDGHRAGLRSTTPELIDAYRRVYAHIGSNAFDVTHSHGFDPPAVSEAVLAGIATLHTLHLPPSLPMVAALGAARCSGVSTRCAAVSRAHRDAWRTHLDVDAVLANGVATAAITVGAGSTGRAVVAARLSPEKGVAEGIDAARRAGLAVDVFGAAWDAGYAAELRQRWAADPLVRFRGPVPRRRLWSELGSAQVVLCLSQWDEPFGMVAAEAQAAGTPVVTARGGGFADIVIDGVTGFLVDATDAAVAAAAAAVARSADLDRWACRRHAEAELDIARSVLAHEAAYRDLAATASDR